MLEFAVLGLLHEDPLHGYELRRRLNTRLGAFRALSFGTLYPCLASLQGQELVSVDRDEPRAAGSRRQRITYTITEATAERSHAGTLKKTKNRWRLNWRGVAADFDTKIQLRRHFALLPEAFTLRQLQDVHEAILGTSLNKPAFRRRMLDRGWLAPTGAREAGKLRAEGKSYVVKDGDVMHFLFNN